MPSLKIIFALILSCLSAKEYLRVCYYLNAGRHRKDFAFFPDGIDSKLCSHVVYSSAKLENNQIVPGEWSDESREGRKGTYEWMTDLRDDDSTLKILLSVKGRYKSSKEVTYMLSTGKNRKIFVVSSIEYLRRWKFDGLHLDFEYSINFGNLPLFAKLIQSLRLAFDREKINHGNGKLLLSTALAIRSSTEKADYEIKKISRDVDFITALTYDFNGTKTAHHAPLFSGNDDDRPSVHWVMSYWKKIVLDTRKLLVGLPTHGRCYILVSSDAAGEPEIGGECPPASNTSKPGLLAYYEICQLTKDPLTKEQWLDDGKVPYLITNGTWIGYDDTKSIELKVNYIKKNNFGGWYILDLSLDDFRGTECGLGNFPLLNAANDELIHANEDRFQTLEPIRFPEDVDDECDGKRDGLYYHPFACTKYLECRSSVTRVSKCSKNLLFDEASQKCTDLRSLEAERILFCLNKYR